MTQQMILVHDVRDGLDVGANDNFMVGLDGPDEGTVERIIDGSNDECIEIEGTKEGTVVGAPEGSVETRAMLGAIEGAIDGGLEGYIE